MRAAKTKGDRSAGNVALCQMTHQAEGEPTPNAVVLFVRDLRALYGSGYDRIQADKMKFMKGVAVKDASAIAQFTDVKVIGQKPIKVDGLPAVRTDYTCRKGDVRMTCFTVHVLRGHKMFTGIFIGNTASEADVAPAFEKIVASMKLSVTAPPKR